MEIASGPANRTVIVVYRLYGHYSFNARDGGAPVRLALEAGYSVGEWIDGSRLILGGGHCMSVEKAIYNGFACIVD
jgi:hypothetical protein